MKRYFRGSLLVALLLCLSIAVPVGMNAESDRNDLPHVMEDCAPAVSPEDGPTATPESAPVVSPEDGPTATPESAPAVSPENSPTATPESAPTVSPEDGPTATPESAPAVSPENSPTATPESAPAVSPENSPTATPESAPTASPEDGPTAAPESAPAVSPENSPTAALVPERSVKIYTDRSSVINQGEKVSLWAVLNGFDGVEIHLQWQRSANGEQWTDIPGANNLQYSYPANEETLNCSWRLAVTVLPQG